jgi:ubiquinone/menaquinone biosynthesis C-methylase UbiE
MDHRDHVALIRDGVRGAGRRWLELGAGRGAFTLALAELLGPAGQIVAIDKASGDLDRLSAALADQYPAVAVATVTADFERPLDLGPEPFDGLLAANALHFIRDRDAVIGRFRKVLRPGGRIVIVEYDADSGNPWVPHPFSYGSWQQIAAGAGLTGTRLIGRVPSRFLGAIYAAASDVPASDVPA